MLVKGKIIVVTGGGNGMGRELVLNLLAKGAQVAAVDKNESALLETAQLAQERGGKLTTHILDIADRSAVEKFPEQVIAQHGAVDGLINNAGIIQPFVRVQALEYASIDRVMQVNFYGTLYMIKSFLPYLRQRPEAHILNVSSMGGFLPVPGQSIYGASKAAVKLLSEGLYAELMDTKIGVSVVFPGAIGTNISFNSGLEGTKLSDETKKNSPIKMMDPALAAAKMVEGLEKNKMRIYVGNDSKLLNLLYRINPGFATRLLARQMKSLLPK